MLYTYSKCILLAIWQVLYPLGCFKTLYGFTECKINEWMNEKVVRGRGHSSGMEQTANIKFCFKLGKTAAETVELMRQMYGDNCLSRVQIFSWYARFKSGVETTEDEARPERSFSVRNSLRQWENEYKKNVVWLWEWWLMSLVLTGRRFVKS